MNLKAQQQEDKIRTVDYNCYLDQLHLYNKPVTFREYQKIETQATSRPMTAIEARPQSQKTDYIEDLIKRKTLLNIEYEALKGKPKFQSFLMGLNPEAKKPKPKQQSPLQSPKCEQEQPQMRECKSARLFSSLSIRRTKSAMKARERNSSQQFVKSPLFDRKYRQLNQFPTRKSNLKLKGQKNQQKHPPQQPNPPKSESPMKLKLHVSWVKETDKSRQLTRKLNRQLSNKRFIAHSAPKQSSELQGMIQVIKKIIHR